jgi:hypothetical protein
MSTSSLRVILRAWLLANGISQAMVDRLFASHKEC